MRPSGSLLAASAPLLLRLCRCWQASLLPNIGEHKQLTRLHAKPWIASTIPYTQPWAANPTVAVSGWFLAPPLADMLLHLWPPASTSTLHGATTGKKCPPPQFNVEPSTTTPAGADLPRKAWTTLNRLRTGVGRFGECMHRWGLKTSSSCICGAESQTAEHILFDCRVLHPPIGQDDLKTPDEEGKRWLQLVAEYA
ncbi:unnamed protein product [Clavelina lepadiformis]|uniref:Reverse transcriptase n=1 Tax=Clavelina lepadiformis TaxID=159417 RepID=A0ABP0G422_CLALP